MCEECDVELFMVLPRLIWLRFLSQPSEQLPLLVRLLPHRFGGASSETPTLGTDLETLFRKYDQVVSSLATMRADFDSSGDILVEAKTMLAKSVVSDDDEEDFVYVGVPPAHVDTAKMQVEGFMLELEAWSI